MVKVAPKDASFEAWDIIGRQTIILTDAYWLISMTAAAGCFAEIWIMQNDMCWMERFLALLQEKTLLQEDQKDGGI